MDTVFGILGTTTLLVEGRQVDNWGTPRERAVLATLLANPARLVPIKLLVEWAWPQDTAPPQNPTATFYTYATRIRRSLELLPPSVAPPQALRAYNGGYRLDVDKDLIDYHRFHGLVAEARVHARESRPQRTLELVERALCLWRGFPLADVASERADAWRVRVVHDEWLPAQSMLIDALLNTRQFEEAIARINEVQGEHPTNVLLVAQRLSALHGLARFAEADAYYLNTRQRLLAEGGDQAADHLRAHQESLRNRTGPTTQPGVLATNNPVPRQLPYDVGNFVGRRGQLEMLNSVAEEASMSGRGRVVIVDGMAGVGKTALVVHWAHRVRQLFPDGDLYVDLNGFSNRRLMQPATVIDDFLIALGHPPDETMSARSRELFLSQLLSERKTLVVLDNARNSTHVRDLISHLSNAFVIVTSRQQLRTLKTTTSATRVRVEPMDSDESAALLASQLGTNRQRVAAAHTERLASLCGGLPLFINLVADHIAHRSAESVAALADQFDLRQVVTEIDDDDSVNTNTFFDSSYRVLAEPERRLFCLLALIPGKDFSITAAYACDGRTTTETTASVGALVAAHLLEHHDAFDRYRFHDLLAEYARYRAESDEASDTRRDTEQRILGFYLTTAVHAARTLYPILQEAPPLPDAPSSPSIEFADAAQARAWFDQERTNLIAAITMAADHQHHDYTWRLGDPISNFFDRCGYHEDSRIVRELAVTSARAIGHREAEASSLGELGLSLMTLGDYEQARRCLDAALRLVEEDENERGQSATLHQLARLEMLQGNPTTAVELYQRCLDITHRNDDLEGQAWTNCRLGHVLRSLDQHQQALVCLHAARWTAEQIDDRSAQAAILDEIGSVHYDRGDHDTAAAHCEQALTVSEAIPDLVLTAQVCITLAEINSARKQPAAAITYARRAVGLCQHTHNVADEARALEVLGNVEHADGNHSAATQTWRLARDLYQRAGNTTRATLIDTKIDDLRHAYTNLPTTRPSTRATSAPGPIPDIAHQD